MITGDYPRTAQNIANQIGLVNADSPVTGTDLIEVSDDELKDRLQNTVIKKTITPFYDKYFTTGCL